MSRYDENSTDTYEDRLLQYNNRRARSSMDDLKKIHDPEFTRKFYQYAEDDDMETVSARRLSNTSYNNSATRRALLKSEKDSKTSITQEVPRHITHDSDGKFIKDWTSDRVNSLCTWFMQCVPACLRHRKDVQELFSPESMISIINDSKVRAASRVKDIYQNRSWGAGQMDLQEALVKIERPCENLATLLTDIQSELVERLSAPGSVPSVKYTRDDMVQELADRRVHDALYSDRVRQVEVMLHSTNVPERFTFGNIVGGAHNVRNGTTDQQRIAIQRVWDTPGLRKLAERRGRADDQIDACYRF